MKHLLIATTASEDLDVITRCFSDSYQIRRVRDRAGFLTSLRRNHPSLAFVDIRLLLGGATSRTAQEYEEQMQAMWEASTSGPIIVLVPTDLLREAVKAVKAGASNYLTSPLNPAELNHVTESIQEFDRVRLELDYLRGHLGIEGDDELLKTNNALMREVLNRIKLVASTRTTVLLSGETGVGKSTLAKLIHKLSNRAERQFIAVHCGAIPETLLESELFGHEKGAFTGAVRRKRGKFEVADGGTIFLDEIGLLTPAAQIKLLGVIQERSFHTVGGERPVRVDVRIIAATNIELKALCNEGQFRRDLYYRVNVFPLEIPPLRDRVEDIPLLIRIILQQLRESMSREIEDFDPQVMAAFASYKWPGNVRELENLIERAFILETTRTLTPSSFPTEIFGVQSSPPDLPVDTSRSLPEVRQQHLRALERRYLEAVLHQTRGRINDAARVAGLGVRQLHKLLLKHDLHKEHYR